MRKIISYDDLERENARLSRLVLRYKLAGVLCLLAALLACAVLAVSSCERKPQHATAIKGMVVTVSLSELRAIRANGGSLE